MAICVGGPLHYQHALCGEYIYTHDRGRVVRSYELREYWYNDGSVKKIQLYQHYSYSDECIIKFLNEKFNLSPVEKKS